jgi:hypothetical protein
MKAGFPPEAPTVAGPTIVAPWATITRSPSTTTRPVIVTLSWTFDSLPTTIGPSAASSEANGPT